jgi:hypothetical protein
MHPRSAADRLRNGVSRAESLQAGALVQGRTLALPLIVNSPCTLDHNSPGTVLNCTMATPQASPSSPWLQHSGGIREPVQTAPIQITFARARQTAAIALPRASAGCEQGAPTSPPGRYLSSGGVACTSFSKPVGPSFLAWSCSRQSIASAFSKSLIDWSGRAAPSWLATVDVYVADGGAKDLSIISGATAAEILLVDDTPELALPHQRSSWVPIRAFSSPYPSDDELRAVARILADRVAASRVT